MSASRTSDINVVLDSLAAGDPVTDTLVTVLSDLDRTDAAMVASRWDSIPLLARAQLVAFAMAMSIDRVDLDFQRVAIIAARDPEPDVRRIGLKALSANGGIVVAELLADIVEHDDDPDVIAAAGSAGAAYVLDFELGRLNKNVGDRLVEAMRMRVSREDLSPPAHGALLEAVSTVNRPWVGDLIRDAYYSDDRDLRLAAVTAMGNTADEDWLEFLEEQMQSDDSEFRRRAAEAAGNIASEDAIELLAELLEDEILEVVSAAVTALAEIGGPEALEILDEFQQRAPEGLEAVVDEATEWARDELAVMKPPEVEDD